jgi:hypothetical protein
MLEKVALRHVLSLVNIITTLLHTLFHSQTFYFSPYPMVQQLLVGHGLLIIEASRSHSHTLGSSPLDKWTGRRRHFYLATYNTHKRQTSMPPAGFESQSYQASGRRPTPEAFADHTRYLILANDSAVK